MTEPIPPEITPKKNPIIEPPMKIDNPTDLQKNNPQKVTQPAQDFLDGYKQTYGSLPYVAEIKGGYIKNQAWHNLSEYAKAEVIKMLEKQNTG